jgi:anti-sigma factor RsiW
MIGHRTRKDPSERDLVALADGTLSAARRARVERAVAASPELSAQVSEQRRVLTALRTVGAESMPSALRARLELARDPRPTPRPFRRLAAGATTGAVAVAAFASALVLALGGGVSGPTVAAAATLGTRGPLTATGATRPGVTAAGIQFPDWSYQFGLKAAGVRRDSLDGRLATTVFYLSNGGRIAYTIVSGSAIRTGTATRTAVWSGTQLRTFSSGKRAVVSWLRDGHTCVLSGPTPLLKAMMRLASWKGDSSEHAVGPLAAPAGYLSS